jgi:hypothetical protein
VRATVQRFHLDPAPFEKIFAFRASDNLSPTEKEVNDTFGAYLEQIDRIIQIVDEFDQSRSGD